MDRITLSLPLPPSANNMYTNARNGGRFKTKAYKAWIEEAGLRILQQKPKAIQGAFEVIIYVGEIGVSSRSDADNRAKATIDLLTQNNIITDDNRKYMRGVAALWVSGMKGAQVKLIPHAEIKWQSADSLLGPLIKEAERLFAQKQGKDAA